MVRRLAPVIGPVLTGSGCQASAARQTVLLDTQQASIAATIAGVAHRQSMPRTAVTVAYATAMQESKLHNLDYGDMDSVGVFQQRPSEGWGPRDKLEDPVYATIEVLPRAQGGARVPAAAHLPGRPGRAAQRGRVRLHPVREDGRGDVRRLHRTARACCLLLVVLGRAAAGRPQRDHPEPGRLPSGPRRRAVPRRRGAPCCSGSRGRSSAGRWRPGWSLTPAATAFTRSASPGTTGGPPRAPKGGCGILARRRRTRSS